MFPTEDTLIQAARIVKSYGTDGDVMISFPQEMSEFLQRQEPVWLFYDSLPVPFFICSFQSKGPRKAVVHFEDMNTAEDAEEAVGKDIYLDPARYPDLAAASGIHAIAGGNNDGLTLEDLIGFTLLDQKGGTTGTIADIQDFSGNICLELSDSGTLVPFHDDLIIDIDIEKKTLTMSISEGLL